MISDLVITEKTPMQFYGGEESDEVLAFVRLCPNCGRFVKPDDEVNVNGLEQLVPGTNANCSKCGRVEMPFDGWWPKK